MNAWYTLYTKPNAEYQVRATLAQRGIQTYLPEIVVQAAAKEKCRRPFFPCYVFARINFKETGAAMVQWTPGLRWLVAFDEEPAALTDEVMALLRAKVDSLSQAASLPRYPFKPGETVRIKTGSLQDMLAVFDDSTTNAQRVQVLLQILGRACRVKVAVTNLEKVESQKTSPPPARPPRRTRGRGRPINKDHGINSPVWTVF